MRYVRVRAAAGSALPMVLSLMLLSAAGASRASAAPALHCDASPLRATVLGTQAVEPVTQGRGADCATGAATPSLSTPLLHASALTARTTYDASGPAGAATGGVASLQILPTPEILAAGRQQVVDLINALPLRPITLSNPVSGLPLPIPIPQITGVTLDLHAALLSLIPPPATALLSADVLDAQANVTCQSGAPALSGSSTVAGLKVLGLDVGLDGALNQALPLINSRSVSLSQLLQTGLVKVYAGTITDPTGLTPILGGVLTNVLAQLPLDQIPAIEIPPALADVQLRPSEQIVAGTSLTQRALHATIALAGQPILDAVLGEAHVSADAGACPTAPVTGRSVTAKPPAAAVAGQSVADQLLACSDRKLVLVDVLKQGGRVKLLGAANRDYVGKRVAIRLRRGNAIVAHATVEKDGSFETTAPLPSRAVMASHTQSNTLRYRAEIGKELSLPLKLQRRLIVNALTSKDGKVTISGRVVRPLTTPLSDIRLVRRVSCHKVVLVKRFKPNADGTFKVTVPAPKGQAAAVYRMATDVREQASNPRKYPTFTLPRGVALDAR
ncbi:hypothetical protein DSM104299_02727 [Baekduia alba]|uniref:hypothetical protein n=1 Tax=Baekduia alba TaxID=2997333 RepID=UPI0023409B71|nr:hypothetical protein [Baekduia alba]WCB93999.1 hypothetical protein DSM104299_02727 [Baekduia alba]